MKKMTTEWASPDGEVTVRLHFQNYSPVEFFERRHELFDFQQKSIGAYSAMEQDERDALTAKVRRSIAVMHDQVEQWLPDGIEINKTGDSIRVEFTFLMAEIEAEAHVLNQATRFEIEETVKNTKKTLAEIDQLMGEAADQPI